MSINWAACSVACHPLHILASSSKYYLVIISTMDCHEEQGGLWVDPP